jgi:tetratricopeptide (TPR) repeat protein
MQRGRPEESLRCFEHSLALFRSVSERRGECFALHSIGETYHDLHRPGEGIQYVSQALTIRRQVGDRQGEGEALRTLGDLLADTDRPDAARQSWHQALAIFDDLDHPNADEVRKRLARALV